MALRSVWRPWKDEVVADGGAVASERPLTSEVGIDVLRQGGNAVDAAVAMGFCAAVIEPQSSCVAGHGQMLVHMNGRTTALDFSHRAPKAATPDMYNILRQVEHGNGLYEVEGHANAVGHLSAGVPGTIAGCAKRTNCSARCRWSNSWSRRSTMPARATYRTGRTCLRSARP